jgi:hypothetical protein
VVDLLCGRALGGYQARDPLTVLLQLMQIDEIAAELGLDQTQVAPASDDLAGCLLDLVRRLSPRPFARRVMHQQRQTACALQHLVDSRPGALLALVEGQNLGHFIAVQWDQTPARPTARIQPIDQGDELRRRLVVPVGTKDQKFPGDSHGGKAGQRLQRRRLGQVQIVQNQEYCAMSLID